MSVFKRLSEEDLQSIDDLLQRGDPEKEYWFVDIKAERELEYPYYFCEELDINEEIALLEPGDILTLERVSLPQTYYTKLMGGS